MTRFLLKHARIVDPVSGLDAQHDLLISDGTIERIGADLSDTHAETVDLTGNIITPGFCDMHVHFREPGQEHKEDIASGVAAAAAGGFTAVACMPNTDPPIDTAAVVSFIFAKAAGLPVDVHPIGAITKGRKGESIAPMIELRDAGVVGFSDDGSPVHNTKLLRTALEYASMLNLPLIQHAEDPFLFAGGAMNESLVSTELGLPPISRLSEDAVVQRDLLFTEYVGGCYHLAHMSTVGAADAVRAAKARGLRVTSEVAPHHFTLTDEVVRGFDSNVKMNPPLRTADDVRAMKEALRDGTADAIATDHAPHAGFEKEVEFVYAPFGIVGLETAVGLAFTELVQDGWLTLPQLIEKFSTNPRRILRLPELRIAEGMAANLTFLDPAVKWTVDAATFRSKSRNTPFHGRTLTGRAVGIFNNGMLVLSR
ncbi:MAG: dihydroorotase [Bacteroidota bacterium]|jgi:dihydroorotase|nr:dihydroorotase [Bacteroidota bacterium]